MNLLAVAYSQGGRPADAARINERVLAVRKERLGRDHADTLVSTSNLAVDHYRAGRSDLAVPLLEAVLAGRRKQHGPNHADTRLAMTNLAGVYRAVGRAAEAITLFEAVLAKRKGKPAPQDDRSDTELDLAHAYQKVGRWADALPLFERSLAAANERFAPDHPTVSERTGCLVEAYEQDGKHEPAERLIRDRLERVTAKEGADSVPTASWQARLGLCLLRQKRYAEADSPLRACRATRDRLIPDEWLRFNALSLLGGALAGQGKPAEAEPLLVQGAEGLLKRAADLPAGRVRLAEVVERLAAFYEAAGRPADARAWRDKLKAAPPAVKKKRER